MGKDEIVNITGFFPSVANIIKMPLSTTDAIEEQLNDVFEQKLVQVQYTINRKNMEKIVHEVILKN